MCRFKFTIIKFDKMEISYYLLLTSNTVLVLASYLLVTISVYINEIWIRGNFKKQNITSSNLSLVPTPTSAPPPPGPPQYPFVGNLFSLHGYEVPYQAFDKLVNKYGPIVSLRLGVVPTVIVNGINNIKEVLIAKSSHFDSRPNFYRYHKLFCGNKENSLAFCNWSKLQKLRREMLVQHSFPRNFSIRFNQLNEIISNKMITMTNDIKNDLKLSKVIEIKPILLTTCANIFTQYFCSREFARNDKSFLNMITNFDKIFTEINKGYAADFLPFLLPLHAWNFYKLENWSHNIRNFILDKIIENRKEQWSNGNAAQTEKITSTNTNTNQQMDYVDSLIDHVENKLEPNLQWDTALFALEDIIGGHAAVANFLVKLFGYVSQHTDVQVKIQQEIDNIKILNQTINSAADDDSLPFHITLGTRNSMPYTEAVILEALRLIASPIVPHVANRDSTIAGYEIKKDTLIMLNNYNLNMSEELWDQPMKFMPERFLRDGAIVKPDHFLPFGAGRRSCMGYKMVQLISFSILSNIMQHFNIKPKNGMELKVVVGSLAVPMKSYEMEFTLRE